MEGIHSSGKHKLGETYVTYIYIFIPYRALGLIIIFPASLRSWRNWKPRRMDICDSLSKLLLVALIIVYSYVSNLFAITFIKSCRVLGNDNIYRKHYKDIYIHTPMAFNATYLGFCILNSTWYTKMSFLNSRLTIIWSL